MGVLAFTAGLMLSRTAPEVMAIAEQIKTYRESASAVRLLGISALALAWPTLVKCFVPSTDIRFARLHSLRWRVTAWLLILEIVLGQNLLGRLFA